MAEKKKKHHRGRRKKRRSPVLTMITIIALIVFCVSAFQLLKIGKGYMAGRQEYDEVQDAVVTTADSKSKDEKKAFRVDFKKLQKMNEDTVGWIRFSPEPSQINYPVVQGEDNERYLHQTFTGEANASGAIFMDTEADPALTDSNTVIYGHRMKDGSMFRHLQDYEDKEFWEENPHFYIYTPDGREITYHIFSAAEVLATSDVYRTSFNNEQRYGEFLKMVSGQSLYGTDTEVTVEDKVVTLSTCTSASDEHRFVVCGKQEKEEKIKE